jgi:TetR/AcrR family transcriptional regulator, cholesterol catabolism regulator
MAMSQDAAPGAAVQSAPGDSGRERILAAAAGLFREHGYAAVSLRAIAARAGMQGGSLYHHFRGKEEIVGAVLDLGIQRVHEAVESALAALPRDAGAGEAFRAAVAAHLDALLTHSDYTSANVRIFGQVPPRVRERNKSVRRAYEQLWSDLLDRAHDAAAIRPAVDRRLARRAMIGALNATLEWFDSSGLEPRHVAAAYADLFLHGILTDSDR